MMAGACRSDFRLVIYAECAGHVVETGVGVLVFHFNLRVHKTLRSTHTHTHTRIAKQFREMPPAQTVKYIAPNVTQTDSGRASVCVRLPARSPLIFV